MYLYIYIGICEYTYPCSILGGNFDNPNFIFKWISEVIEAKPIFFLTTLNFQNWIKWTAFPIFLLFISGTGCIITAVSLLLPQSMKMLFLKAEFELSSAPTASLSFPFELQSLFVLYLRLLQYFMVLLKCCPHHFSKSKPLIINTNKNRGQEVLRFPSAFH